MKQVSFFEITITMILLLFIAFFCVVSLRLGSDFAVIIFDFLLLVYLPFLLKKHHVSLSFFLPEKEKERREKGLGQFPYVFLSLILAVIGVKSIVFHLLSGLDNDEALLFFNEMADTQQHTVWYLILSMLLAPLVEELFFRGILTNKLARSMNIKAALLISVLVFSIAHWRPDPFLILGGLFLNIVYIKTQSLLYPIVFHSLNNLFCTSFNIIFIDQPGAFRFVERMRTLPDFYVWLIYLLTFGLLIYPLVVLFIWVFKKKYTLSDRGRIVLAGKASE